MSRASAYVLASLISGVSAALILTGSQSPSYTHTHARGNAYSVKWGQSVRCRASSCQIAYLNSLEDFCLWAPSRPELDISATSNMEHTLTAWCIKSAYGSRLVPDGTISWAHFVKTPEYIQIAGVGNLTNINMPADGVASTNGEGSDVPGLVFTSAYGQPEQIYDWMSFVSQERFCFRACNPSSTTSCPRIHDVFGCSEDVSGNLNAGTFEDCIDHTGDARSDLYQGVLEAPPHYPAPPGCAARHTIGNERATRARRAILSTSSSGTLVTFPTATATDGATTITFPSLPTSTFNATASMNSTTSGPHSFNHTTSHTHRHSHPPGHSHHHHHFTPLTTSVSSSSSASSNDPPSMSAALSPTSVTSTTSDPPSSMVSTSSVTPTPTEPSSASTSSTSTSSHGPSSVSELAQPSPSPSPSTPSTSTAPSTTTPSASSTTTSLMSRTTPPSMPSQSSVVLSFAVPSPSDSATSSATSSSTFRNTATQLGSQCPPVQRDVVDAGSITTPPSLLLWMVLTIILSTSIGIFII